MARNVKYVVKLESGERLGLADLVASGKRSAATRIRARVLLEADAGPEGPACDGEEIAEAVGTSPSTVHRVRQDFVEEGLEESLSRKRPTGRQYRKLDGAREARLVAVACGAAPEGRSHWTMQLLADRLVELEVVDAISPECVRTTLKKTRSSRGLSGSG
jgi:transposase